jgi:hypothetical protein
MLFLGKEAQANRKQWQTMVTKIISGGETGVDRAALDWAIMHGVPHGGYCPRGRRAEDGETPPNYQLTELPGASYLEPTRRNVLESDGTLLITAGDSLRGGSALPAVFCRQHGKPLLHIKSSEPTGADRLASFVEDYQISVLNVAGPRASSASGMESVVHSILDDSLQIFLLPCETRPSKDHTLLATETNEEKA